MDHLEFWISIVAVVAVFAMVSIRKAVVGKRRRADSPDVRALPTDQG